VGILNLDAMRQYLSRSLSSVNENKLRGILAEIDFRQTLVNLGFADRVSPGGWIARSTEEGHFGHSIIAMFPETIQPDRAYDSMEAPSLPPGLHSVSATLFQRGISPYFCYPRIDSDNDPESVLWTFLQLGLPTPQQGKVFPFEIPEFSQRLRKYPFLKYQKDTSGLTDLAVPDVFSKENMRVTFNSYYYAEMSDIDAIFWGNRFTYPIEIKEKSVATGSPRTGPYFGLDQGPFVKLAFYAAKQSNLHSLFVVREIDNKDDRNFVNWWFITYDRIAEFASWVNQGGGPNMLGGSSSVVKIPKSEFQELNSASLGTL